MMVEFIGVHGADHQQVVGYCSEVRKVIAEFHAALAVRLEDPLGAHQLDSVRFDEGKPGLVQNFLGQGLAISFIEFWLGVKQVQV